MVIQKKRVIKDYLQFNCKQSFVLLFPNEKSTIHIVSVVCNACSDTSPLYDTSSSLRRDVYDSGYSYS